jgi:2-methylisocitrate lyase-like PEP mutase family enzyme
MPEETRRTLREMLDGHEIVVAPGAYDGLTARLVERAGFPAVYVTGSGVSYTRLAQPDLALVSFSEMVSAVGYVAQAVDIPVIADADTGYGNHLNLIRCVREYQRAGATALQIEDQVYPKKCGHLPGRELISTGEMVNKIRAAKDAASDPDFLVIARTDAIAVTGIDDAIARARAYRDAGADLLYVEGPESTADMAKILQSVPGRHAIDMVEGGRIPLLTASELQDLGYSLVIFPNSLTRAFAYCGEQLLGTLRKTGGTAGWLDRMYLFDDLQSLLGADEIARLDREYGAAGQVGS